MPCCFKGFFRCFNRYVSQLITKCDQAVVGVVINQMIDPLPLIPPAATTLPVTRSAGTVKRLDIGYAHDFDVAELAHGPGSIVIDVLLRITGTPKLIVEQGISNAAVGLIHAHDVRARRKLPRSVSLRVKVMARGVARV